jgi:hypothetical protein
MLWRLILSAVLLQIRRFFRAGTHRLMVNSVKILLSRHLKWILSALVHSWLHNQIVATV